MDLDLTALVADPVNALWRVLLVVGAMWLVGVPALRLLAAGGMYAVARRRDDSALRERAARTMPRTARLILGVAFGVVGIGAPAIAAQATPTVSADRIAIAPVTLAPAPATTPAPAPAPDPVRETVQSPALRSYTVQSGDCLWSIAEDVYETAGAAETDSQWRAIWRENRIVIGANPGIITPGMVLTLPGAAA